MERDCDLGSCKNVENAHEELLPLNIRKSGTHVLFLPRSQRHQGPLPRLSPSITYTHFYLVLFSPSGLACLGPPRGTLVYSLVVQPIGDGVSADRQTSVRRLALPAFLGYRPEDIVTISSRYLNLRDGHLPE